MKTKSCVDEYISNEIVDDFHKYRIPGLDEMRARVIMDVLEERVQSFENARPRLLDIGCGAGEVTRLLAQSFENTLGVDASSTQISKAKEIPSTVEFITGTGENLPVNDGTVDIITSVFSLQYLDVTKFTEECHRVLKPGGVVVCYMDTLSKISSTENENLPDTSSMLENMYKKYSNVFKLLRHPQWHIIDRHKKQTNSIDCLSSSRVDMKTQNPANLEAVWRHQLTIPMYGWKGATPDNPMIELVQKIKKMWFMEHLEDESINVNVTYHVSVIIMKKEKWSQ